LATWGSLAASSLVRSCQSFAIRPCILTPVTSSMQHGLAPWGGRATDGRTSTAGRSETVEVA